MIFGLSQLYDDMVYATNHVYSDNVILIGHWSRGAIISKVLFPNTAPIHVTSIEATLLELMLRKEKGSLTDE